MKTSPPILLCILSFLLASGGEQGSSTLHCLYDSVETVICSWTPTKNDTEAQCQLTASVDYGKPPKSCQLQGTGNRSCQLILTSYSLTTVDDIAMAISCRIGENWMEVQYETFTPFQNIQLQPPCNVQLEKTKEHAYNLTWNVCILSHYFEGKLEYQVRYKINNSDKGDTILHIDHDQKWLNFETLDPDTAYEAAVRAKLLGEMYKSVWSNWSMPVIWRTDPKEPPLGASLPVLLTAAGSSLSVILIVIFLMPKSLISKCLRKVLKIHLPDPAEFFPSLTAVHEGDVQKWLSSPLSKSSFQIATAAPDVSVLEIMQTDNKEPPFLFPKEYLTNMDTLETSGHSSSSRFTNGGYFFFHHLDSFEIEPCKVYFTYDPIAQESSGSEDGDSYKAGDNSEPQHVYGTLANQGNDTFLQVTKDRTQAVGGCLVALPSRESLPTALAVEPDEKEEGSEPIVLPSKSPEQYFMSWPNILEQSSIATNETEGIRNVDPPTSSVEINRPAFLQCVMQNQGQVNDLCRAVSSSQITSSSEAYLSLRDLQSHYNHHSV
ncbi:interleukin-2 receptor subunit beta [Elgaria multicarinata webbii]|uniref:interleukin-2 receptor subunit beta n=1 Tax=Elgaria multicarinata webbii TaxID=159646 RepID=UPI002FCD16BE